MIQQLIGKWMATQEGKKGLLLSSEEKEILRYVIRGNRTISAKEAMDLLQVGAQKARMLLRRLLNKGYLMSASQNKLRIRRFRLAEQVAIDDLSFL